jgi:hypothetical protein
MPLSGVAFCLWFVFAGAPWIGIAVLGFEAISPLLAAEIKARRALASPLNKLAYVLRFTDDSMEQLVGGERRSLVRYSDIAAFDEIPEGLRLWVRPRGLWLLIPRTAFASADDFLSVCEILIRAGKMKRGRSRIL